MQQSYDAIGRLCAIGNSGSTCSTGTTFATGMAYNKAGQVTAMNYGNGVAATLGYTPERLLLQSLSYAKGATTLLSLSYGYTQNGGNNGQITGITDSTGTQEAGRSMTYSYDALYRLSTAVTTGSTNYPQWGLSWAYDRYGNRTAQTVTAGSGVPSNSVTVSASTNRIAGSPYAYDANGNMTNDGNNTLVYDAENRVLSATNGSASGSYTYDGNNLRVKKVSGGTTTVYIFSGSKVLAEYDNAAAPSTPTREYIYSGGVLLAKIEAGATNYYHSDHLSARVITDSSGTVIGQRAHYPYGETWYETGTTTKIKFTSYERDPESGNDFAMMRYSVNRLGRFNAPDALSGSISDPQSLNRYSYTQADPIDFMDPLGLQTVIHVDVWAPYWPFGGGLSNSGGPFGGGIGGRQTKSLNAPPVGIDEGGGPDGGGGFLQGIKDVLSYAADRNRCAANNAGSAASALGISKDNWLGQSLLGNDISSISRLITGPDRGGAAGDLAMSNPTPVNAIGIGIKAGLDWIPTSGSGIVLAQNGAGTYYGVGATTTTLRATTAGKVAGTAVATLSAIKLVADVANYFGSLIACSSDPSKH